MSILDTIISSKRVEVSARRVAFPLTRLVLDVYSAPRPRDFRAALADRRRPAPRLIAEIKRRSPSRGEIRPELDPVGIARLYQENGAAAVSVLADSRFFGGSLDDLADVRASISLPVLCKEFIVDPYQIYEARTAGADAVLLIASVLSQRDLCEYRELAEEHGMAALVEVHNEPELARALASGATLVGINNRDLHTFTVSLETTRSLMPLIPPHVMVVSESGLRTQTDRAQMFDIGVDAILVGESLLASSDLAAATAELCGLRRPSRVGQC
ncbi:MAG TPA: indole-3-glycerol phosphate synthase TrpC [Chloroflexia bacterium]|nr:indole-3-glycerol phosphate synthase TrpC [Chloroflexia bacterium]